MGYRGQVLAMPLNLSGYQAGRDKELLEMPALVDPSRNCNFHQNGIGKRGGTEWYLAAILANAPIIRGGFQLRLPNGNKFIVWATSDGKIYHTNETHLLKTGMSVSNFYHFSYFNGEVFIADGATVPQHWNGIATGTSNVTAPTSWATDGYPFQIVQHSRGANKRNWAITRKGVWASKNNDGADFSDANAIFIPVYAEGGLVAGFDFGGILIVWSNTKTYLIDDSDPNTATWGYQEAIWEGGAAHWRLMCKALNDLYIATEEGLIYSLHGVQATGDYTAVPLTRPAFIDRYIQDNVVLGDIAKFHCAYDRKLRAIKWFVEVGGSPNTNQAIVQFIDRPIEKAWILHDNALARSGYDAACSFEVQVSTGRWETYTGDFGGMIWKLEQALRSDHGAGYVGSTKWKPFDFEKPRVWKHFRRCTLRTAALGNFTLTVRKWIDGIPKPDSIISIAGTGAAFDSAIFDTAVFASDDLFPAKFDVGGYGYKLELEILNSAPGEDFFHSLLTFDVKNEGVR